MFEVNRNPSRRELQRFGWAMLIGFGLLGAVGWIWPGVKDSGPMLPWRGSTSQWICLGFWIAALALWTAAFAAPPSLACRVYVAWMSTAMALGIVVSTLLLTVLFVLLLPIFSLVVRMGDPLRRRLRAVGTYWEDHKPHAPTPDRVARPF